MKIYTGYPGGITKITNDKGFYQTEDLANVISVYVNQADVTGITYTLALEFLRADGRKTTIYTEDSFASGEATTLTEENVTYDIHNFTLTNTQLAVAGALAFTCYINILNSGVVEKRGVLFNAVSNVRKTVTYSANTIFVVSEDEEDVPIIVADMKTAIETLSNQLTGKVNTSDVADNLTTNDSSKVLSAKQGYILKTMLDTLTSTTYTKTEIDNKLNLKADKSDTYTKTEINNYKKMWDNLVYSCEFTIDDSAKTMTISGSWAFTKYSFIVIDNIAVKTISYASLSLGNYCLVIRNNALEFVNFANAIQDGDMVLWIGFIDSSGDIRTDIYRCNNKVTNLALYCSDNIKIDTTNKNFVIPNGYLFWNSGYASITAQNISYASYLNATCVLVYRNGVFKVLGLQNIELFYNDVIVAVVWFRGDGFPMSKIYVVNEAPDKAITELPLSSKIFMRVGVIGDSYTSGWIKDNDHKNNPNYSWVKYMKQLTGNEWTNFGVSGSSTKSWVDGTLGQLPQVQTKGNKCQAYVIGLMINDQNQGMQTYVPLGTSSDIGTNANSYYAYYYKLINALLSVNSSAIIFCNTCPRTDGDFPSYNQAVIDVVNYCQNENKNVYLVELRNYYWRNETFNNDALNGHYTAIGYEYMAEIFNKAFSDTINANASSLKEVNLIPYDSATVYDYVNQKINDLRWELGSHTLDVESDTTTAFSKSVPANTIGCQINQIGCMSYKSENLLELQDVAETTTKGITYNATNGIYTLNGTATANSSIYKAIPLSLNAGTYILNSFNTKVRTFISIVGTDYNANTSFTLNSDFSGVAYYNIYFTNGVTFNNDLFKPMLVKGSTAPTTYQPYFSGIRNTAVTSVVSRKVGLNSLRLTQIGAVDLGTLNYERTQWGQNYVFQSALNDMIKTPANNVNLLCPNYSSVSESYLYGNVVDKVIANNTSGSMNLKIVDNTYTDVTAFKNAMSGVYLYYELATELLTPQQAVLDYFVKDNLNIPSQIQALTGYGWGINDTCYNYIDFDRKVFVQKVGRVDLGSLDYEYQSGNIRFRTTLSDYKKTTSQSTIITALSSMYKIVTWIDSYSNDDMCLCGYSIEYGQNQYIYIKNTNYTDATTFKSAMNGVYLYYELATPIETDISAYLTTDTIDVEPNGTLEFTNTYSQDVPSDIDYLIEEVKA